MPDFQLTPAAEQDLLEINEYTLETWGEAQARKYLDELFAGFERLLRQPAGKNCDDIRAGLRSKKIGKHVVYYFAKRKMAEIVNILHQNMDPLRHLDLPG